MSDHMRECEDALRAALAPLLEPEP